MYPGSQSMAHTIQTPRTSSPPADLRPAPLRIPLRKSVASFDRDDDPEPPLVTKHGNGARDALASTLSRNDLSPHSHPAIPHTLAERHDPGSKLESLVSRFEILDAVNRLDQARSHELLDPNNRCIGTQSAIHLENQYAEHLQNYPLVNSEHLFLSVIIHNIEEDTSTPPTDVQVISEEPSITYTVLICFCHIHAGYTGAFPKQISAQETGNAPKTKNRLKFTCRASAFLSRGGRSSPQETRQEDGKILSVPMELDPASRRVNEKMGRQSETNTGLDTSMDGVGGASSNEKKGDRSLVEPPNVQYEPFAAADASGRGQLEPLKIPLALSSGDRPTQGCGKVSQLRRFFERSSKRLSSPLSFVNFRSRLESEESIDELTRDYSSSSWNESEYPTSTHTIARKISIVPSLTTEISVNDFFCDFVGPSYEENSINASPSDIPDEVEPQTKRESPVKRRIQQFEHLSRDSLKAGASTEYHSRYNDVGLPSTLENENRAGGKRNTVAGWRPIHRKGVAIWRKISSSFSRSLDSWKDCNSDREPINLTENTNSNRSPDRSPLPASNSGFSFRRPSPFGYSMYRVPHKSRRPAISSNTTSSIQIGSGNSPRNVPKNGLNTSYSRLSLDTPPSLAVRKSPPFIARMTGGLHLPGGFGLDGHFPSKPVEEEEEFRPSEATTSELSTPQGDPNALLKVMLKQSAEERSRHRQDEKHLRRDKTFKTLARWKEKCKVDVAHHFTDDTDESAKKHDKGKGKGKERETARGESEGQCEQDTETNKKTESGFVVFESKHVKLRHPKPRRPGQGRKLANMYRDKGSSGVSVTTKASSGATLKDSRQGFRQKASSALGLGTRKRNST
ncbi:hypothetical protein EKO27_g569 [Xylaria grammica]|uniref:Uncharacterized protein n=1 Tax=Xylaria grammica TaxID=363999 RepID=A0A439DJE7_9PEZI|nr:hypothetical protein EKO27_g569 [Xylaria grammica]